MKTIIAIFLLTVNVFNTQAQTMQDEKVFYSTVTLISEIQERVNEAGYDPLNNGQNIRELEKIINASNKLVNVTKEYSNILYRQANNDKPIKGADLAIFARLLDTLILIMEKSSLYTTKSLSNNRSYSELEYTQIKVTNLLAKINYVNLYLVVHDVFYKNPTIKKLSKEIIKIIDDEKKIEIIKQFSKIAGSERFNRQLQNDIKLYIDYRYYYLKLLNPDLTRGIVLIDNFEIEERFLAKRIPEIEINDVGDWFTEIFNRTTNFVSGMFGNLVGKLRFRHGYMHENEMILNDLESILKPLDIIAEKTPFAATDFFIPGHFGHVAIYLGTEEKLKNVGLWNTPFIQQYHNKIRAGKVIVESIRPGSRLASLEEFLEIDEITIIREKGILDNKWTKEMVTKVALEQLDKEYDFNFDVTTLDKVVCSEVPYHAFGHKRWPTSYILGRNTVSPDEIIANAYYKDSQIEFISSIKANEEQRLFKISKEQMGNNLGFEYDSSRDIYTKMYKSCRLIKIADSDRYSNINGRYRTYKKCKMNKKDLIYSAF
ncbi:NlpC-P60 family hydrolase [Bacteriovorax sp. BAL6_X]|uniref:YiiX/YebB-like N1pC/P60 family cysteine hydrolase n=1 Tax=Bacteriovorax sp. BAL6_X TaxID=1201290 RepID=UPI000386D305|nr:YiiX/YebB-like N1pC/P60 family cysteine hydrolase [Bacteriovorax sp. BAL6_X]EPZ51172.1 NlpC-P60 family hydrolase [Bacteriovorax sp. BAL6_X]